MSVAFRIFTLLAVIALAVSTWILSSPSRRPAQPAATQGLPGYYLKNAILTEYDASGSPSIRIQAERIDQVDHGSDVALYDVRLDYQAPGGQSWVLFGDTGHVGSDGRIVDVAGNVRLEGQTPEHEGTAIIRTDTLRYDVPDGVASTRSDVRIEFGAHTLTARGLVANLKDRTVRLESKVNGRFQP
ncbi:MAG TPA: LPS export ABC transporter periplasmic protein LptC [Steroidobacteraceae bacterium]|nr:LPS export ABC transporter periplasmic protein LptC [Steroidobacteraceae bacterium]